MLGEYRPFRRIDSWCLVYDNVDVANEAKRKRLKDFHSPSCSRRPLRLQVETDRLAGLFPGGRDDVRRLGHWQDRVVGEILVQTATLGRLSAVCMQLMA